MSERKRRRLVLEEIIDIVSESEEDEDEYSSEYEDEEEEEDEDEDQLFPWRLESSPCTPSTSSHVHQSTSCAQPTASTNIESTDMLVETSADASVDVAESESSPWTKDLAGFPAKLKFTGLSGLQGPLELPPWDECRPVDFYKLFINKEFVKHLKAETNRYARKVINDKMSRNSLLPNSRLNGWSLVTQEEMYAFLAIIIHMSIVRKPQIQNYWTRDIFVHTPLASKLMSKNRFLQILAMFHVNDNATYITMGQPGHDPLHKVRPLINHLNHAFKSVYLPEQDISIDEAVCQWRGRVGFQAYMKDNPTKWGMKIYELCESSSGYVWNFEVMCHMPGLSNKPFDVVHRLLRPLMFFGYTLYVDKYYCCPALAASLQAQNTGLVGTVRSSRAGLPKDLFAQKLENGEMDFRRRNNTVVLRWKTKRDVAMISTIHKPEMVTVKTHREEMQKPLAVVDYNKNRAGVDRSSQMIAYMPMHRKSIKWWKKLTFHLLTLTMVQAHCLYQKVRKHIGKPGMQLEAFFISVGTDLANMSAAAEQASVSPASELSRLKGKDFGHFLGPVKSTRCYVCYNKLKTSGADRKALNNSKRTAYECKACKKPLCIIPCFEVYHTVKDFAA